MANLIWCNINQTDTVLFKFSMCFEKWICGKYFVLVTFQPLRGRQKYVVGKTDHPLAAGFQAHVQQRDNIEGGEREVSCRGTFGSADCTISGTIFLPPLTFSFTATLHFPSNLNNLSSGFYLLLLPDDTSTLRWHFSSFAMTFQLCFKSDRPKTGTESFSPFSLTELNSVS